MTDSDHQSLSAEATARTMTVSRLTRAVITAHIRKQRAELPQARGMSAAALRELTRIGNNLNQLTRQANTGFVAVAATDLRACLDQINAAARRLG